MSYAGRGNSSYNRDATLESEYTIEIKVKRRMKLSGGSHSHYDDTHSPRLEDRPSRRKSGYGSQARLEDRPSRRESITARTQKETGSRHAGMLPCIPENSHGTRRNDPYGQQEATKPRDSLVLHNTRPIGRPEDSSRYAATSRREKDRGTLRSSTPRHRSPPPSSNLSRIGYESRRSSRPEDFSRHDAIRASRR